MQNAAKNTVDEVLKIFNNGWNKQVILYGPPGTSKTYSATDIAAKFLAEHEEENRKPKLETHAECEAYLEKKDGQYKVSLRSNDYVDVSIIASKYAGGGHLKASGFSVPGPLEQAKETVLAEIRKQLKD